MKKICVYTCIVGDYDVLKEIAPLVYEPEIDYYCFTTNKNILSKTWKVIYIDNENLTNVYLARKYKILGCDLLTANYDISVWLDGTFELRQKITSFLTKECDMTKYDLVTFKHSKRKCLYQEAKACIQLRKSDPNMIKNQISYYKEQGYPENNGLAETGIIVRNVKSDKVKKFTEAWFAQLLKFSPRDQLSFSFCLYNNSLNVYLLPYSIYDNPYFLYESHANDSLSLRSYRVYFDNYDDYTDEHDFSSDFEVKDDQYLINLTVPCDCSKTVIELPHIAFLYLKKIFLNGSYYDKKITYFNYLPCKEDILFYNRSGGMEIYEQFKKGDTFTFSLEMKALSNKELSCCLEKIYEDMTKTNETLKLLQQENSYLKDKNKELNTMITDITSSKSWKFIRSFDKIRSRK